MTAGELMGVLRRRGVELLTDGDRLGVRPAGRLTPEERTALIAAKADVLSVLRAEAFDGDQLGQLILRTTACTPEPSAWRLYSRRLGRELWLARDTEAAAALDADGARAGLPVVLADDLEHLRDFDDQRLRDLLEALTVFPGARVAVLDPEVAS